MPSASNASRLIALFGGVRATATATGLDIATVSRWTSHGRRGTRGHVPTRFNEAVMTAAKAERVSAQAKLYLCWECPTCGAKMKEG